MTLFESEFMRRARYLTEDKRAFLLDTIEQTRQTVITHYPQYEKETNVSEKQKLARTINQSIEKSVITTYLLLNSPIERTAMQVEKRLEEIEKIKVKRNCENLYTACYLKYQRVYGDYPELEEFRPKKYDMTFSEDPVPKHLQERYKNNIIEYMELSDIEREKFISEVTHPYSQHQTYHPIQIGRGARD